MSLLTLSGGRKKPGGTSGHAQVPGWNDEVEPAKQDALLWHFIWKEAGRPNRGTLHDIMSRTRNIYHYAVRKVKRRAKHIKAVKLFEAAEAGDIELLKEMKRIRGGRNVSELPEQVAGADGEHEIVDKFREVYEALYNSIDTAEAMVTIKEEVDKLVNADSIVEVSKITGMKVKEAATLMKPGKGDVSGGYTSDALLHAPDILFEMLASIFRSWLLHGNVTRTLLACAFMPLLKSSLKDPGDVNSYRAIAGSSLLLKLFDKVILLVWGGLLSTDTLQFGYKTGTSTTECSWLVSEVASYFLRKGNHPIITLLDCTKAFDKCRFDVLFRKLIDRGLPGVVIRTLIYVYEEQYAWVRWGNSRSAQFGITNGTRQGSVLSPALFAVYMDELLLLSHLKLVCDSIKVYLELLAGIS